MESGSRKWQLYSLVIIGDRTLTRRISGGSEDVMLDLMIRQLVKNYQRKSKQLDGGARL